VSNRLHDFYIGFYLHKSGILGASPDGIDEDSCLEMKCPYTHRKSTDLKISLALPKRKSDRYIVNYDTENKSWIVNEEHEYYHQIQSQMYFAKRNSSILFIWTPATHAVFKFKKNPDWEKNIDLLIDFYVNEFATFVLNNPDLIPTR
jgi:hypothetical protein